MINTQSLPKDLINKHIELQHTKQEQQDSTLYTILKDLAHFLNNLPADTADINNQLADFTTKIIKQCHKDNASAKQQANEIINLSIAILNDTQLQKLDTALYAIIDTIKAIFMQYVALLSYIDLYKAQCNYNVTDDNPNHIQSYYDYTDRVFKEYVEVLITPAQIADGIDSTPALHALYTLLLQCDYATASAHTNTTPFIQVMQAIQNNAIFNNRQVAIITLSETIAVTNLINLMWYIYKLYALTLNLENADNTNLYKQLLDLINAFLASKNPNLLKDLEALLRDFQRELANKGDISKDLSEISYVLNQIAKLQQKTTIQRYADFLDTLRQRISNLTQILANFKLEIDMQWLHDVLSPITDCINNFLDMLNNTALQKYYDQINALIDLANKAIQTIREVTCLLKQAMCLINNCVNFIDKNLTPAINQIKSEALKSKENAITTLNEFEKSILGKVEKALRVMVYEQARVKLKQQTPNIYQAIGKDSDLSTFSNLYTEIVDTIINQALGMSSTDLLNQLKAKAKDTIDMIYQDLKDQATNTERCQPILQLTNLKLPQLSLRANTPRLNAINLDIQC